MKGGVCEFAPEGKLRTLRVQFVRTDDLNHFYYGFIPDAVMHGIASGGIPFSAFKSHPSIPGEQDVVTKSVRPQPVISPKKKMEKKISGDPQLHFTFDIGHKKVTCKIPVAIFKSNTQIFTILQKSEGGNFQGMGQFIRVTVDPKTLIDLLEKHAGSDLNKLTPEQCAIFEFYSVADYIFVEGDKSDEEKSENMFKQVHHASSFYFSSDFDQPSGPDGWHLKALFSRNH